MQYKGLKRMKRVSAVILSAALLITGLPQTGTAYAAQMDGYETEMTTEESTGTEGQEESGTGDTQGKTADTVISETIDTETETPETGTPDTETSSTEVPETETSDSENSNTETSNTETTNTEVPETETSTTPDTETSEDGITESSTESETETEDGTETAGDETTEPETEESETTETEVLLPETEEQVSIPEVDTEVYVYEPAEVTMDDADTGWGMGLYSLREENGEYIINNKDEFLEFLDSGTDYSGKTVKLNCSINLNGKTVSFPVEFMGTFDGNGYSLENLRTDSGLFKTLGRSGTVRNLHISKASFDTSADAGSAGVVAGVNRGKITNIIVTGTLETTSSTSHSAGIAAVNESGAQISNCVFAGELIAQRGTAGTRIQGGIAAKNDGTITECHTYGTLASAVQACAGIAAENNGNISKCSNYMNISSCYNAAGIVSSNTYKVTDCTNYGRVVQNDSSAEAAPTGGIVSVNTASGEITKCYNHAEVRSEKNNAGGIAGLNVGNVSSCGNMGAVSGHGNVGGIIGQSQVTGESRIVEDCFNTGNISGNGENGGTGIGGIVGASDSNYVVNIEGGYNRGKISGSEKTDGIGGIAGIIYKGSIKSCYNAGSVSGARDKCLGNVAGLLTEQVAAEDYYYLKNETVTADYYKKDGDVAAAVTDADRAKTAEELKTAAVRLGFVADSDGKNAGYPVISGQGGADREYLVAYDLNGGHGDRYYELVADGDRIFQPQSPEKKNAEFKDWFTNGNLTDSFPFGTAASGAVVIYAGWDERIQVTDFTFPQTEVTLVRGETFPIAVNYIPADAQNTALKWASSDTTVATVDETGRVTAVAEVDGSGKKEAVITARIADGTLSKECTFKVSVTGETNIVRIMTTDSPSIELKELSIAKNNPIKVQAVVGGTGTAGTISWSSSKPASVKVESSDGGGFCTISGLVPSSEPVIVSAIWRGEGERRASALLEVMVCDEASEIVIGLDQDSVTGKRIFYDLVTRKFVAIGENKGNRLEKPVENMSAWVLPSGAIQKVEWASTDTSVIKFEDKNSGVVMPNSNGDATITVTATDGSGVKATTEVRALKVVRSLTLEPKEVSSATPVTWDDRGRVILTTGGKVRLIPTYNPSDATRKEVAWSVNPKGILTIDPKTSEVMAGEVTKDTEVTVSARSLDLGANGDGAETSIKFIIKPRVKEIKIYRAEDMKEPVNDKNIGINPANANELTVNLKVKNSPENASQIVTWKSSNEEIAKITDNGDGSCRITVARKEGTSVITATAADGSGVSAKTTINVTGMVSRIIIRGSHNVVEKSSITLTAEVEPKSVRDKTVTWISVTPDIAIVDAKTGKVTGVKAGPAIIRATANDGSRTHEDFDLDVTKPIQTFYIIRKGTEGNTVNGETILDVKDSLNNKSVGVDPDTENNTCKLDMYVYPKDACQTVTWASSNKQVATVDEDGTVTAVGLGTATVTATSADGSGKKASVKVNVTTLASSVTITGSHYVGAKKSIQLKAEVGGKDAANKNVIWSSSDKILSVNDKGKVSVASDKTTTGSAIIRAEAADGSGKYAEHKVYIMGAADKLEIVSRDNAFPIEVTKNKKHIDLDMKDKEFETLSLTADLTGGTNDGSLDKIVEWTSSNNKVAAITSVEITGGKSVATVTLYMEGKATITARTADGYGSKDTCTINVDNTNPLVVITGPKQVGVGKKIQLSTGKTAIDAWSSSDKSIATVNSKGQVTAKSAGLVHITAEAKRGTNAATYDIMVSQPVKGVDIAVQGADGIQRIVTKQKLGMDIKDPVMQLSAIVDGDDNTNVTWKSNKAAVAKVDQNGTVEALKAGTATITATATDGSGKKATVTITVAKQVTGIEATNADLATDGSGVYEAKVAYKKSVQLKLAYKPLAATTKKAVWKVAEEDKSYISVNSAGKVTAKAYLPADKPYATVIATAADNGGQTCTFHIYITPPASKVVVVNSDTSELAVSTLGIDLDGSGIIRLGTKITDKDGGSLENQRMAWKSNNTKIASVDGNGVVTGLKTGTAVITGTVQDGTGKSGKITIYVGKIITDVVLDDSVKNGVTLGKGMKLELMNSMTILPVTATNQKLTFKTSNKNVVTVDSKGKITSKGIYKKNGITYDTAVITVSTNDGSNIIKTIEVKVTK